VSSNDASGVADALGSALLRPFGALRESRGFRALLMSNVCFFSGVWSHSFILGWMVYAQTQSEIALAVFTSLRMAPLLLGPLAGVLSDRFDRRRVLLIACAWVLLVAAAIAVLTSAGAPPYVVLLGAGLGIGIAHSPSQPARSALTVELVSRERLSNANALNALVFSTTLMVGPAIGGGLVSAFGAPAALWVSTGWYAASLVAMLRVPSHRRRTVEHHDSAWRMLTHGARRLLRNRVVAAVLTITILTNALVYSIYQGFMPVFARQVLDLDAADLGALLTCFGVGGMAGSLIVAALGDFRFKGAVFVVGTGLMAILWALFALSISVWLSFVLLTCAGLASAVFGVLQTTLMLAATPGPLQGRAMGLQELAIGVTPLAAIAIGVLAQRLGIAATTFLTASLLAVALVVIAFVVPALVRYHGTAADHVVG
jgi:predicted MFS family arabinose efflux permease